MDWEFENGYQREGITFLHISRRLNESIDGSRGHVIIKVKISSEIAIFTQLM